MAKKLNNSLYIGIAAVVVVIAVVIGVMILGKGAGTGDNGTTDGTGGNGGGSNTSQTDVRVTAAELSNAEEAIEFGDYEGMYTLSKSIQNGEMTGKVVQIDGLVQHPGTSYSVVQENEDGSGKIGTVFIIDDATDADYPADGDHIIITGKVVETSTLNFTIVALKDFVSIEQDIEPEAE